MGIWVYVLGKDPCLLVGIPLGAEMKLWPENGKIQGKAAVKTIP